MKNMFESGEVFAAYARIDFCYYWLKELANEKPLSPIEQMVDNATGHNPLLDKVKQTKELLQDIIHCKKLIEADYSGDEKALNELKNTFK